MDCSILIRAYNEARYIGRLLEGIQQQTLKDVEVILVDSGSTDGTIEIAESFPNVRVVNIRPDEFTFGRSLNRGMQESTRDLIVIASAHVYPVYPDWLERLLDPFKDPKIGLTYGKQRGTESSYFSEHQIFANWFPENSQSYQPYPFCNNANAAIRRSLWVEHPYNESLPGLEDLAWARWLIEQGYSLSYVSDAEIIHVHHETPQGVYNRYRREGMAFKQIYPHEHFNLWDLVRHFTGNVAADLAHAHRKNLLQKSVKSIFWFRWMQFYGTFQGYRQSGPLTWQLKQAFYYPAQTARQGAPQERDVPPIQYQDPS